eukprot:Platyproteum_vivax@DN14310_c0_g1_i1.p1
MQNQFFSVSPNYQALFPAKLNCDHRQVLCKSEPEDDLEFICDALPDEPIPPYDKTRDYFYDYLTQMISIDCLLRQVTHLKVEIRRLRAITERSDRFKLMDESHHLNLSLMSNSKGLKKRKFHRRTAAEVPRKYFCPYLKCPKAYGTIGSLKLHIRRIHGGDYNSHHTVKDSLKLDTKLSIQNVQS